MRVLHRELLALAARLNGLPSLHCRTFRQGDYRIGTVQLKRMYCVRIGAGLPTLYDEA